MSQTLSTKEAAAAIGTDARTLRKFIRSDSCEFDAVGQGKRYEFTKKDVNKLKKAFLAWGGGTASKKRDAEPETEDIVDELTGDLIDEGVQDQDDIDLTTEEVDLDDNDEPAEVEWTDDAEADLEMIEGPTAEDLDDIEIEDIDLD